MAILVDDRTRLLVQGITGRSARVQIEQILAEGTRVVGGVTPGRGGQNVAGLPVFDTVAEACAATDANTSLVVLPPGAVRDGILEAIDAELPLVVCVSEGAPQHDMLLVADRLRRAGGRTRLLGPNCPGLVTPRAAKVGTMPNTELRPGGIGIVAKSGTLAYEASHELLRAGLGQSTWVGIGGDPLRGTSFTDVLPLFAADPQTRAVLLIGEIGGREEERAALMIGDGYPKPVVALIAGRFAPEERPMGHAGALITAGRGTWQSKVDTLREAGAHIADSPRHAAELLARLLAV